MWRIEKKGYSRSPWRLVNGDGTEVATTCSKTGVQHPVSGQTRAEVESWVLDRLEWYARNARAGVIPTIYSPNWRNSAEVANTATVPDGEPASFEEWFDEYDKQNHHPEMLARAAWDAAMLAAAPTPQQPVSDDAAPTPQKGVE